MPAVDRPRTQLRIDEAEEALHRLVTGKSVQEVVISDYGSTRYTPADAAKLQIYIDQLRRELAPSTAGRITNVRTSKGLL
jgi:hypothetical protein